MRRYFDPQAYRIVLFDQRGCGRSLPHASDLRTDLSVNTTTHLLADLEQLRQHLGIDKWLLFGNSWGSTLGLPYAERHPQCVTEIVLAGVTTTRRVEIDWLYRGVAPLFPAQLTAVSANTAMSVDLVDARHSPTDRDWLTNVYPFYLHDLSEFDDGYYRLSNDGRWEPDHLPSWLADDTDYPFIIRTPRGRVGFALVNAAPSPHIMRGADYRLAEFFVLRTFRRARVGRRAAFALFDHLPGIWEIRELPRNSPAIAFWRAIITEYAAGWYEETMTHEEVRQVFDSRRRGVR